MIAEMRSYIFRCRSPRRPPHELVTYHLDYSNSLLHDNPQYQQQRLKVLNAAARVVRQLPKYSHIFTCVEKLTLSLVTAQISSNLQDHFVGFQGCTWSATFVRVWMGGGGGGVQMSLVS